MVIASNKRLGKSGDDHKPPPPPPKEVTSSSNELSKVNNIEIKSTIVEQNLMSSADDDGREDTFGAQSTTTEASLLVKASSKPSSPTIDNANENVRNLLSLEEEEEKEHQLQLLTALKKEEENPGLDNNLKTMANRSDFIVNDEITLQEELETARTAVTAPPSQHTMEQDKGELENNNHAFSTLIESTLNNIIVPGLDGSVANAAAMDSNINMLNNDLTAKSSNTNKKLIADDIKETTTPTIQSSSIENKDDRSSFFNTLTISGGNIQQNTETTQNIVMNNANVNANANTNANANINAMSYNKPVNPVYALDTARSSALNIGSLNTNANKITTIINGGDDMISTATTATANNGQAKIVLMCEQSSHPFQTRTILLTPNIECKVGRLIAKCKASESNAIFDCKVLSRNHAVLWYSDDGKFWVKDTKSSNGTFINDKKLGNDAAELHFGDIVKFGVDVLENSRKEVHGCIIASVKLYLPDGRQAILAADNISQRSQYSGESRISFDDLHRLNVYMQETSQREKALKSKLYNIQNLLDATRKNSSTCWQAMISEDQLLHRIHSLEKKIQILEKNMPENSLKNEILKLIDDKSAYQHSAKEALRGVYLERCEAMQKLAKLESDFTSSENECKILRDQITCAEEAYQDVSARLLALENEHAKYRSEIEQQHQQAKEEFEERIGELAEKLQQREDECESLRNKISELMQKKRTQSNGEGEDKLQMQAIENLDAVIAGMDIGDDDDDDDDDDVDDDVDVVDEDVAKALKQHNKEQGASKTIDIYDFNGSSDSSSNGKDNNKKCAVKPIGTGEATIMKWLKNSDLNRKEGSMEIFNAICNNESDSSDDQEHVFSAGVDGKELINRCFKFEKKLQKLGQHIKQLEGDVKEYPQFAAMRKTLSPSELETHQSAEEKSNLDQNTSSSDDLEKLKKNVFILHESFAEIFDNFKQLKTAVVIPVKEKQSTMHDAAISQMPPDEKLNNITTKPNHSNKTLPEINEVDNENDSEEDNNEVEKTTNVDNKRFERSNDDKSNNTKAVGDFLVEIADLKSKLNERDHESQQMLEMLQIECETHKLKVNELLKLTDTMRRNQGGDDNRFASNSSIGISPMPTSIGDDFPGDGTSSDSGVSSVEKTTETAARVVTDVSVNTSASARNFETERNESSSSTTAAATAFEKQINDELETINSSSVQFEEELIAYKECLEKSQKENLQLRKDLLLLQKPPPQDMCDALMRSVIPMGIAVVGVLAYLITTYF